jgi:hypothetical protein
VHNRGTLRGSTSGKRLCERLSCRNHVVDYLFYKLANAHLLARQWLIREFPELSDCLHQHIECDLTIFDRLSDAVFRNPALKVDCFSGRSWKLNPCGCLFQDPPDFLEVVPGAFQTGSEASRKETAFALRYTAAEADIIPDFVLISATPMIQSLCVLCLTGISFSSASTASFVKFVGRKPISRLNK